MKHIRPSDTTVTTDTADSPRDRVPEHRSHRKLHNTLMKSMFILFCLALGVMVYVLAHRSFSKRSTLTDTNSSIITQALEVEVLDGAGSMKIAQHVTNALRSQGYDVVEMKRNNDGMVERSYVIDHSGNLEAARKLATNLGLSQDKVFQKIDHNLYLDVSVIVGKDFSRLKVFQVLGERSKH